MVVLARFPKATVLIVVAKTPAPDGPIYSDDAALLRLYWPKETPPSILPPGEVT
jgi:hypothetical protein